MFRKTITYFKDLIKMDKDTINEYKILKKLSKKWIT